MFSLKLSISNDRTILKVLLHDSGFNYPSSLSNFIPQASVIPQLEKLSNFLTAQTPVVSPTHLANDLAQRRPH